MAGIWICRTLTVFVVFMVAGCAVDRSGVSMDSNSRSPWMNLELAPSRKKDNAPNYHRAIANRSDSTAPAAEVKTALLPPKSELRLPQWLHPGSEKTPLPLPRTDLAPVATSSSSGESSARPDWWDF